MLVALVLAAGCADDKVGKDNGTGAQPSASPSARPDGVGPHRSGDCLDASSGTLTRVDCGQPHEYEVVLSAALPEGTPDRHPPDVPPAIEANCRAARTDYLRGPDADATRLEVLESWPNKELWDKGDRWFACVLAERGEDNNPVRRTGALTGALAAGLGPFQRCMTHEPLANGPLHVVPCDKPHRSEAVPGVLVLGLPTDPAPSLQEMADRAVPHCERMVADYLGGPRPGVKPRAIFPLPEEWPGGRTTAVCYAVSDTMVTGPLRG